MKKLALIFGAGLVFASPAIAQVIDPEWKAIDTKMRQEDKTSCSHKRLKNIMREEECSMAISRKYERNGDVPGTEAYVKKHYGHMSNIELSKALNKYNKYTKNCRDVRSMEYPLPGEITCSMANETYSQMNFMLHTKGGGPNPFDQIFGKGTSFGRSQDW